MSFTRRAQVPWLVAALGVGLLSLLPVGVLVAERSWEHIPLALAVPAIRVSLLSGGIALGVVIGLGLPSAWYLARHAQSPLRRAVELALLALLLTPPLVLGLVLAFVLGPTTGVGMALSGWGISPTNSWFALVVAEVYEALPYFVLTASAAFEGVPRVYEEAALSLVPQPWRVWREVTLPLAAPGLIAAAAMAWARVVGAFGAVIVVAYHPAGLPLAIWVGLEEFGLPAALPLALILLAVGLPVPWLLMLWRRSHDPVAG